MRCSLGAAGEPLAGTAPLARWWWLVEVPGPWGAQAVAECRVPVVRALSSTSERRVVLVRPGGRHPAVDPMAPLRIWIAGALPTDPPPRVAIVHRHEDILDWPAAGPDDDRLREDPEAPVLAVCANAARDMCCGLDGRALVQALDDDRVWECSHLGGHRFAPTALLVRQGLVYGRLDGATAQSLLDSGPTPETTSWLRGRSALPPAAQVAEIHFLSQGVRPDLVGMDVQLFDDKAVIAFADLPTVEVGLMPGQDRRPVSCGAEPETWSSWRA